MISDVAVLIPSYKADSKLTDLIGDLHAVGLKDIIVVRDGDNSDYDGIYDNVQALGCHFLEHKTNLGKGAALKTGFEYIYDQFPDITGVITADADGQHTPKDILSLAKALNEAPSHFVLGARKFDKDVPIRSKVGNSLTKYIFRFLVGMSINDTQSGLRAIPYIHLPLMLKIPGERYEYELNMLLSIHKNNLTLNEIVIETVYLDENKGSSFNPLLDSFRVYKSLFAYGLSGLASFAIDISLFTAIFYLFDSVFVASFLARGVSLVANFLINKNLVFSHQGKAFPAFFYYLLNCFFSISISYLFLEYVVLENNGPIIPFKISIEMLLFVVNFYIQNRFIFRKNGVVA